MKIAYCLYGFIAEKPKEEDITLITSLFPIGSQIDIYYSCPTILHEQINTGIDQVSIENVFKSHMSGSVIFEWRNYDPFMFIKEVKKKNLSRKSDKTNSYYNRILSLFYSISASLKLLERTVESNSNLIYDAIVVTRYTYIKSILSIPAFQGQILKKGVYIWREKNAYKSDHHHLSPEDRIFYGRYESLISIKDIYSFALNVINPINAYGEGILEEYVTKHFSFSDLHFQDGLHPIKLQTLSGYTDYKTSNDCEQHVNEMYNLFESHNSV